MIVRPRLKVALLTTVCLIGCGETPDQSLIRSGHYQLQGRAHSGTKLGMTLTVDRDARTATFSFPGGSSRTLGWTARPEAQWENGCWAEASDYHTKMEVASLGAGTLALEATTLKNPQLVAGCPEGLNHLSLGEGEGYITSGLLGKIEPHHCEIEVSCFLFTLVTR
jgi:hypothetical protein